MTPEKKRARSLEEKSFRRQQILDAASALFGEVGYEGFSVALLASKAGIVKGTLYLYFKTREEVFLALYDQSLNRWSEKFIQQLPESLEDRAFCELLYETAFGDPLYVPLQARLEKVIEHNVSLDCLLLSKRNFLQEVDRLAAASADVLRLRNEQALEVIKTLGVLIVGVAGADLAPSLKGEEIPEDVQHLLASFSSRPIFVKNAERIIQGVRSD
ncbi:MAG TPA: TetR/AcrR family transcriptional regulator [Halieaceae bacterium]|nr:TetR/AcrR family transcriptional regulator [Halieaceae bacterium]